MARPRRLQQLRRHGLQWPRAPLRLEGRGSWPLGACSGAPPCLRGGRQRPLLRLPLLPLPLLLLPAPQLHLGRDAASTCCVRHHGTRPHISGSAGAAAGRSLSRLPLEGRERSSTALQTCGQWQKLLRPTESAREHRSVDDRRNAGAGPSNALEWRCRCWGWHGRCLRPSTCPAHFPPAAPAPRLALSHCNLLPTAPLAAEPNNYITLA